MSLDSNAAFTNTDATPFPDNLAVNASGPSATDGTEFVANMINNYMFGPMQALLNHAGLTPDGVVEADGTAQIIEALQKGFGSAPGIVTEWNLASDPATTGHRALLLQGQGILRANYPDLDAAVYVGDGNNAAVAAAGGAYFRADNSDGSSPNTAGVYLILPEGRGVTARGLDAAATIDPDGASRYLGDLQIDAVQGHQHGESVRANSTMVSYKYGTHDSGISSTETYNRAVEAASNLAAKTSSPITDGVNGTPRTDSETRMYNRCTTYAIWY